VQFAQDQGWEGSLHLIPSIYLSCHIVTEITAHAITSAMEKRQKEKKDKDTLLAGY